MLQDEKKDDLALRKELRKIFEKFPATLMSTVFDEETSTLTISQKDLLPNKQKELEKLLRPLIVGHASFNIWYPDKTIAISCRAQSEDEIYIRKFYKLIQETKKLYNVEEQAFTEGATAGALSKWKKGDGLPDELGRLAGSFLDRNSAPVVSKAAAEEAKKSKSEKIDEMKKNRR